jgi:hypothetical protein
LFPKFGVGDNPNWAKVIAKARDGAPDALEAVGYHGDPVSNAVCKEVLAAISPSGTKGNELHKRFEAPPFGWPRDAINGAIFALLAVGNIRASQDHKDLAGPKELPPNQIAKATFYKEDAPPTAGQSIAVRGLLTAAEIPYEPGQEGPQVPALLQRIKGLAERAGGAAPFPEIPNTDHLTALLALNGNQRIRAVADDHERLRADLTRWLAASQKRDKREAELRQLERLLRHAADLPMATAVRSSLAAIRDGRQLLDDPDPITPLLQQVTGALRSEVKQRAEELGNAKRAVVEELESWTEWAKLDPADRDVIITQTRLSAETFPDVSSGDRLLDVLDAAPLSGWQDRINLVPSRRDQARQRALKKLQPESVRVTMASVAIANEDDLTSYLDGVRLRVQPHLEAGKTVIL